MFSDFFLVRECGLSESALRWGCKHGDFRRAIKGVYRRGSHDPTRLEKALAVLVLTSGVASGLLAGTLCGLDSMRAAVDVTVPANHSHKRAGVRRRDLSPGCTTTVRGFRVTNGFQTMIDLASIVDDLVWEQALESALRKKLIGLAHLAHLPAVRGRGAPRIRRVLALRPPGAAPTESLLETLAIQLARLVPGLGPPVRQYPIRDESGRIIARADLAWPELGLFIELDGQQHPGQPLYDASRETAIVSLTGWLCGRFTWDEVVRHPRSTTRRLARIVEQARKRPLFV